LKLPIEWRSEEDGKDKSGTCAASGDVAQHKHVETTTYSTANSAVGGRRDVALCDLDMYMYDAWKEGRISKYRWDACPSTGSPMDGDDIYPQNEGLKL